MKVPNFATVARGANIGSHEWAMAAKGWLHTVGLALLAGAATFLSLGLFLSGLRRHETLALIAVPVLQWLVIAAAALAVLRIVAGWHRRHEPRQGEDADHDLSAEGADEPFDPDPVRLPMFSVCATAAATAFATGLLVLLGVSAYLTRPLLQWVPAAVVTGLILRRLIAHYLRKSDAFQQDEFIEGIRLIEPAELAAQVRANPDGGAGLYEIAGIPVPKGSETLNTLYSGVTGSGKSYAARGQVKKMIDLGIPLIAFDPKPEWVTYFYEPSKGRILFNPMDKRSPAWDFFAEISRDYHYKMFADALIPAEKAGSPYWYLGSRIIFADVCQRLKNDGCTEIKDLYEVLCLWPQEDLFRLLAGTASEKFMDPEKRSSKELHSSLISRTQFLSYFMRRPGQSRLVISDFTEAATKGSALFLTSTDEMMPIVINAFALQVEIAVRRRLSLPDTDGELKLVLLFEEFAAMTNLPVAQALFTRARSKGCTTIMLNQEERLLDLNYGDELAQAIRAAMQTKVILRQGDNDSAEKYSQIYGTGYWWRKGDSIGIGAEQGRETMSFSRTRDERMAVPPYRLIKCRTGTGYLMLPGEYQPTFVRFPRVDLPRIATDFEPRDDLAVATGTKQALGNLGAAMQQRPAHESDLASQPTRAELQEVTAVAAPLTDDPWDGR